jgi:regulator of replication initiation timing
MAKKSIEPEAGDAAPDPAPPADGENWPRDSWDFGFPDREEIWGDIGSIGFISWARRPFWSIDECAALALGKDPGHISGLGMDIEEVIQTTACGSNVEHIYYDIEDAQAEGELPKERIRPVEFLAWAKAKKVRLPNYFEETVLDYEGDLSKLRDRIGRLRHENQKLRYEVDRLKASSPPQPKESSTRELSKKERNSLDKLILGMALAKYKWEPNADRHPASGKIADDLKCLERDGLNLGLSLDEATVLKYLREAKEVLP